MGLLHSVPTIKSDKFPFLLEVDFDKYALDLATLDATKPKGAGFDAATAPHRLVGYHDRLNELSMILASSNVNNAYIQGVKGSGKSTLIEALLRTRAEKHLSSQMQSRPFFLFDANVFFIEVPREEWIKKFNECLKDVTARDGILIIDNVDDMVHTADNEAGRLSNCLVSHLEQHDGLQVIMASQTDKAEVINATSTGIARQFQALYLTKEPSFDDMKPMLLAHIRKLEEIYNINFTEESVNEIIRLLSRYPGRAFAAPRPTNAIAFADKVGANMQLYKYAEPVEVAVMREKIGVLRDEAAVLAADNNSKAVDRCSQISGDLESLTKKYEEAYAAYKTKFASVLEQQVKVNELESKMAALREKGDKRGTVDNTVLDALANAYPQAKKALDDIEKAVYPKPPLVRASDVRRVFNIEAGIVVKSEQERLKRLDEIAGYIETQIFRQERAKAKIINIYRMREMDVADPSRPAGVFIFVGGTGLGKTELVRAMARFDLGVEDRPDLSETVEPITVNMNGYSTSSSVTNLTGSSRGLVGYDETIPWLDEIDAKPRSFVMFDETDKAHPDLPKALMQVMDTGKLGDSHGKVHNFKDAILVFNLNGLTAKDFSDEEMNDEDAIRAKLLKMVSESTEARGQPLFQDTFLGRADGVVVFEDLEEPELIKIFRTQSLRKINQDYASKGLTFEMEEADIKSLLMRYNAKGTGGRGPRQVAANRVRPVISDYLMKRNAKAMAEGKLEDMPPERLKIKFDGEHVSLELMPAGPSRPAPGAKAETQKLKPR